MKSRSKKYDLELIIRKLIECPDLNFENLEEETVKIIKEAKKAIKYESSISNTKS
jgi:hypothetical protein